MQVNGKMRGTIQVDKGIIQEAALEVALDSLDAVRTQIAGKDIKKIIFVPGKIMNIIAK